MNSFPPNPHTESAELLDIVDEADHPVGRATRAVIHAGNLRHRAVHVLWLNSRGELYVQKRAQTKDTFPGCYDSSAAGHLMAGEDYDSAAVRELAEELSLTNVHPQRLFKINACPETGYEFVWVYRLEGDYTPRPNPAEIEAGGFWSLADLQAAMGQHPRQFAPSFIKVFDLYRRFVRS